MNGLFDMTNPLVGQSQITPNQQTYLGIMGFPQEEPDLATSGMTQTVPTPYPGMAGRLPVQQADYLGGAFANMRAGQELQPPKLENENPTQHMLGKALLGALIARLFGDKKGRAAQGILGGMQAGRSADVQTRNKQAMMDYEREKGIFDNEARILGMQHQEQARKENEAYRRMQLGEDKENKLNTRVGAAIANIRAANTPGDAMIAWQELNTLDPVRGAQYKPLAEQIDKAVTTQWENSQAGQKALTAQREEAGRQAKLLFPHKLKTAEENAEQEGLATELAKWKVKMLPQQEALLKSRAEIAKVDAQYREWEKITDYNRELFNSSVALAQLQNAYNNYNLNATEFNYRMAHDAFSGAVSSLEQVRVGLNQEIDAYNKRFNDLQADLDKTSDPEMVKTIKAIQREVDKGRVLATQELKRVTERLAGMKPPTPQAPPSAPQLPVQAPAVVPPPGGDGRINITLPPGPALRGAIGGGTQPRTQPRPSTTRQTPASGTSIWTRRKNK